MTAGDLEKKARGFVSTISDALNGSITDGIRISYVGSTDGSFGYIGYGIGDHDLIGTRIPLKISQKKAQCFLRLNQTAMLDPEEGHLKITLARYAVDIGDDEWFRYDFDRSLVDWPTAHIQIIGSNKAYETLRGRKHKLGELHFPVGGLRYRPCLEDVIEFLVVEQCVEGRANWRQAIAVSRDKFREVQLRAAVRRDPTPAVSQLEAMRYTVTPPVNHN